MGNTASRRLPCLLIAALEPPRGTGTPEKTDTQGFPDDSDFTRDDEPAVPAISRPVEPEGEGREEEVERRQASKAKSNNLCREGARLDKSRNSKINPHHRPGRLARQVQQQAGGPPFCVSTPQPDLSLLVVLRPPLLFLLKRGGLMSNNKVHPHGRAQGVSAYDSKRSIPSQFSRAIASNSQLLAEARLVFKAFLSISDMVSDLVMLVSLSSGAQEDRLSGGAGCTGIGQDSNCSSLLLLI